MLGLLYRPPRDDLSVLSALESTLEELSTAKLESLVILWDFNIDHSLSKITSAGSRQLGSMSDKFGLKHIVCLPIRTHYRRSMQRSAPLLRLNVLPLLLLIAIEGVAGVG